MNLLISLVPSCISQYIWLVYFAIHDMINLTCNAEESIMDKTIVEILLILAFFVIGAYATTDVSRLLKGASLSISNPSCFCPYCGSQIPLHSQVPIISYILGKGKCRTCHHKIPLIDILPEILLPIGCILLSYLFKFSLAAFLACILLFEGYKTAMLLYYGPRENKFLQNLFVSVLFNVLVFLLMGFLFLLINLL